MAEIYFNANGQITGDTDLTEEEVSEIEETIRNAINAAVSCDFIEVTLEIE